MSDDRVAHRGELYDPTRAVDIEFVQPHVAIDLTNCDREPIHIPGAIQPHGVLLGVELVGRRIVQSSVNAAKYLNVAEVAGCTIDEVLGADAANVLITVLGDGASRTSLPVSTPAGDFDATVYRSDSLAVVELERFTREHALSVAAFRDTTRETLSHIERATTLRGLAAEIAAQMRRLTGFDRIWVYKFHEDWHGEIIGESKRDDIETWLGLHYPASDIPAQARALFLKNWVRMIPDITYERVPLEPVDNPLTGQPLDLGHSVLRSVSPIHIEYLANMGVTASLVISLIHRGELWGLISGHHYSGPKHVPLGTRTLCEFLAHALSLQVGMAEQIEDRERAIAIHVIENQLRDRLGDAEGYRRALTHGSPSLLDLTAAGGAALCEGPDCVVVGQTPPSDDVGALVRWLSEKKHDVFSTAALSQHYPPAAAWPGIASGLLAVALSPKRGHYMLWFRPERRQTISWAGDPRKPVVEASADAPRLSPRGSFALWEEERKGTAEPWHVAEITAATNLRRTILDLLLAKAEEIATMNVELETQTEELLRQREERDQLLERAHRARDEAERANRAKADFLAMMSHELRTPLNAIGGYAQIMEMGARGPVTEDQLADLQRIQHNQHYLLGLINNILNYARVEAGHVTFTPTAFPAQPMFAEVEALFVPQLAAKSIALAIDPAPTQRALYADREKVTQILLNLISNAIKFTPRDGRIHISSRIAGDEIVIDVTDNGIGIPHERLESMFEPFVQVEPFAAGRAHDGVGLGLAISRELARRMHGDLSATSEPGKGSTFTLTLPLASSNAAE